MGKNKGGLSKKERLRQKRADQAAAKKAREKAKDDEKEQQQKVLTDDEKVELKKTIAALKQELKKDTAACDQWIKRMATSGTEFDGNYFSKQNSTFLNKVLSGKWHKLGDLQNKIEVLQHRLDPNIKDMIAGKEMLEDMRARQSGEAFYFLANDISSAYIAAGAHINHSHDIETVYRVATGKELDIKGPTPTRCFHTLHGKLVPCDCTKVKMPRGWKLSNRAVMLIANGKLAIDEIVFRALRHAISEISDDNHDWCKPSKAKRIATANKWLQLNRDIEEFWH